MRNKNIIKKLLFLGLIFTILGKNSFVLSAEAENKNSMELNQLIELQSDEQVLQDSKYLPLECSISPFDKLKEEQVIKFLKYLCTFDNKSKDRSPFIKEDQQIFDNARKIEESTAKWLTWGQAAILSSALSPMIGLAAYSNSISSQQAIVIISVATTFAGLINAWLAFYATGTLPDKASRLANDRQYKFDELKIAYSRMSRTWMRLYFSDNKNLAIEIAKKMEPVFENLRIIIKDKVGYIHADHMLCPLKEAMIYITSQEKEKLDICNETYDLIDSQEGLRFRKNRYQGIQD